MGTRINENNDAFLKGIIDGKFEYSHDVFGEKFYTTNIKVERESGSVDTIPIMVSERLVDISEDLTDVCVKISGSFRSYNKNIGENRKLVLSVFVREFEILGNFESNDNTIYLEGFICKPPVYRKTPFGREIADLLIAVNRPYGKSDYIPSICWGRNARFASRLEVGEKVELHGRIQSREYQKKTNGNVETRVAYEVSVSKIDYGR